MKHSQWHGSVLTKFVGTAYLKPRAKEIHMNRLTSSQTSFFDISPVIEAWVSTDAPTQAESCKLSKSWMFRKELCTIPSKQ